MLAHFGAARDHQPDGFEMVRLHDRCGMFFMCRHVLGQEIDDFSGAAW
jgi:hypothetical protein